MDILWVLWYGKSGSKEKRHEDVKKGVAGREKNKRVFFSMQSL